MSLKPGDRVLCPDGDFGTVTEVDGRYADVRIDTPDGEPSVLTSGYAAETLICPIPENVIRRPRSKEWRRKAAIFCAQLERLLKQEMFNEKDER